MEDIPLSARPFPPPPLPPQLHPRLVPPSLLTTLKANIHYPDLAPECIRWSRELEELFYLIGWDEWFALLEMHRVDLETMEKEGEAREGREARRRYEVRMDQVLCLYYARKSYVEEEEEQGIDALRRQARLNRFDWGEMTSLQQRDEIEERCLNPPLRMCTTPPPFLTLHPATPLRVRTNKQAEQTSPSYPNPSRLLPLPLDVMLADSEMGVNVELGEEIGIGADGIDWGDDVWDDESL